MALSAARRALSNVFVRGDIANHGGMALQAIMLQVIQIGLSDSNGLREILKRECLGMIISIARFHYIFFDQWVRHMAIIAGGGVVMAGLDPGIIILLHHMAVGACTGIIAEIGIALGINE